MLFDASVVAMWERCGARQLGEIEGRPDAQYGGLMARDGAALGHTFVLVALSERPLVARIGGDSHVRRHRFRVDFRLSPVA